MDPKVDVAVVTGAETVDLASVGFTWVADTGMSLLGGAANATVGLDWLAGDPNEKTGVEVTAGVPKANVDELAVVVTVVVMTGKSKLGTVVLLTDGAFKSNLKPPILGGDVVTLLSDFDSVVGLGKLNMGVETEALLTAVSVLLTLPKLKADFEVSGVVFTALTETGDDSLIVFSDCKEMAVELCVKDGSLTTVLVVVGMLKCTCFSSTFLGFAISSDDVTGVKIDFKTLSVLSVFFTSDTLGSSIDFLLFELPTASFTMSAVCSSIGITMSFPNMVPINAAKRLFLIRCRGASSNTLSG